MKMRSSGNHEAIPMGFETKRESKIQHSPQIMKPSLWDLKLPMAVNDDRRSWIMKPSLWDLKLVLFECIHVGYLS